MKSISDVVKACMVESIENGWLLSLPSETINSSLYKKFSSEMKRIGGKWKTGKGFFFKENPEIALQAIEDETVKNFSLKYHYFPTPKPVIEMVTEKLNLFDGVHILEPSAGRGAFMEAISDLIEEEDIRNAKLYYCEIDPYNDMYIKNNPKLKNWVKLSDDFLKASESVKFDIIVSNPPFKDVKNHLKKMFQLLNNRGNGAVSEIHAILPENWAYRLEPTKCIPKKLYHESRSKINPFVPFYNLQEWDMFEDMVYLPEGTFRESGTSIGTVLATITAISNLYLNVA